MVRATVKGTAPDTNDLVIYKANDKDTQAFSCTSETSQTTWTTISTFATRRFQTTALFAKIGGGQFAFMPIQADKTLAVHASVANTLIEYGIFGDGQHKRFTRRIWNLITKTWQINFHSNLRLISEHGLARTSSWSEFFASNQSCSAATGLAQQLRCPVR